MRARPSDELAWQRPMNESGCANTVPNRLLCGGMGCHAATLCGEGGQQWQLADRFEERQAPWVGEEWEQCCGGSDGVGLEEHGGVVDGNGSVV